MSSMKLNAVLSLSVSLICSICTGEQFPFNKLLKLLGQICRPLSLHELKLLTVNEKNQLALIYLFAVFKSILLGDSKYLQISLEKQ